MHYQAVLFDLDGTLLDTLTDIANATNHALRSLGFPEHPCESYKYFIGDGVDTLIRRVLPKDRCDATTMAGCAGAMRKEYGDCWAATTRPYDGVPALLDALAGSGIPMAVFSNKPDEFTRLCVSQLLPRWSFAAVLGATASLPKKPDPAGAREIARRLNVAPHDCVYLGDTNTDMQTAIAAGMFPVGALWGFRTADELTASGAKALLAEPQELLRILGKWDSLA